jgi:xanthine dehydrogenase accessory factor
VDNERIFSLLSTELEAGRPAILVTILAVTGSSMRDMGAHMAVAQDGRFTGSLSGGCIEQAVVAEALICLKQGAARIVRFGAGSPYIDIKLPCGGGLDIHFQPIFAPQFARLCRTAIINRKPFALHLGLGGSPPQFIAKWQANSSRKDGHIIGHWPAPRLLIIGHGAVMLRLAKLAAAMDLDLIAATPQADVHERLQEQNIASHYLARLDDDSIVRSDAWTAIIFLFHDHDWESHLLAIALRSPHFYIGAMGGKTAHKQRIAMLEDQGLSPQQIASVHAPIGLFHSARDPDTLAVSVLSEVIKSYQNINFSVIYD